jgi:hypothetical protein
VKGDCDDISNLLFSPAFEKAVRVDALT